MGHMLTMNEGTEMTAHDAVRSEVDIRRRRAIHGFTAPCFTLQQHSAQLATEDGSPSHLSLQQWRQYFSRWLSPLDVALWSLDRWTIIMVRLAIYDERRLDWRQQGYRILLKIASVTRNPNRLRFEKLLPRNKTHHEWKLLFYYFISIIFFFA